MIKRNKMKQPDSIRTFLIIAMIFLVTIAVAMWINHRPDCEPEDQIMDTMEWECGESDEFKMWIGQDGDTIWE